MALQIAALRIAGLRSLDDVWLERSHIMALGGEHGSDTSSLIATWGFRISPSRRVLVLSHQSREASSHADTG